MVRWFFSHIAFIVAVLGFLSSAIAQNEQDPTAIQHDSQKVITASLGTGHLISPVFIGYNGGGQRELPWNDPTLRQNIQRLAPGNLRYPGGTIANYWDWRLGGVDPTIDPAMLKPWVHRMQTAERRRTLEQLAEGSKISGYIPIFVLNMVTRSLEQSLEDLRRAEQLGLLVRYVELGNEFYFPPEAHPLVHELYPTAEDYAQTASEWAAAIKREFPNAQVAALGAGVFAEVDLERRRTWNQRIAPHLEHIDALTLHFYIPAGVAESTRYGEGQWASPELQQRQYEQLQQPGAIARMLAEPIRAWAEFRANTHVPAKYPIWLTEYAMFDRIGPVRGIWAHALFMARCLDTLLADEQVTLTSYHNLYGGPVFTAIQPPENFTFDGLTPQQIVGQTYALTAAGQTLTLFAQAANGHIQATPLELNPTVEMSFDDIEQPAPAVSGWRFTGGAAASIVLVNYASETHSVDLSQVVADGIPYTQLSAPPLTYIKNDDSLTYNHAKLNSPLVLPAYSITRIQAGPLETP